MTAGLGEMEVLLYMKQRRSDQEWQALIQEYSSSGLSAKAWCARKQIPVNTFYYRIRRLRQTTDAQFRHSAKLSEDTPEIVPLRISEGRPEVRNPEIESPAASSEIMLHFQGITVSISEQASFPLICSVIKALRSLC